MGACCSTTATNCCFSTVLLGYACSVGGINKLQNKFAFPAPPATYSIANGGDVTFLDEQLEAEAAHTTRLPVRISARFLHSTSGSEIGVFLFEPTAPLPSGSMRLTLLWSHGNAMDCGELYSMLATLATHLQVNIVAYDYSGYGASTGVPSERNLLRDALAVYDWIGSGLGVDTSRQLVVYGQSVGSGPSTWLATTQRVRGLILHSPIASGIRVLAPNWTNACSPVHTFYCCDIFPNVRLAPRITCPTLFLHGTNDEVVHWRNTEAIARNARRAPVHGGGPVYVAGAGHNDVAETDPDAYLKVLHDFLGGLSGEAL